MNKTSEYNSKIKNPHRKRVKKYLEAKKENLKREKLRSEEL